MGARYIRLSGAHQPRQPGEGQKQGNRDQRGRANKPIRQRICQLFLAGASRIKDYDVSLYNLPPAHRFNGGMSFDYKRCFGNLSVAYVGRAFGMMCSHPYSADTLKVIQ